MKAYNLSAEGNEYLHDGYVDYDTWYADKGAIISQTTDVIDDSDNYRNYISDDDWAKMNNYDPSSIKYIKDAENKLAEFKKIHDNAVDKKKAADEEAKRKKLEQRKLAQEQKAQQVAASSGSGLTKSSGVNYHGGRKETYYSSRVLYHYRTSEWTVDAEGFYRDSAGYYVVAASDMAQGTVFQGSKGACKVYDTGCPAGVTDYYVNF